MDVQWFLAGEFERHDPLARREGRALTQIRSGSQPFLLEEHFHPEAEAARAATEADLTWQHWMTLCEAPNLLIPLACRTDDRCSQVLYPYPDNNLLPWHDYVEQVFEGYMAHEELTLELCYRLSLSWGAMLGRGLRPVQLVPPSEELVLLTGDGALWCLPPRFDPEGAAGPEAIVQGLGELMFWALTRQAPSPEQIPKARDINREISLDAASLLTRTRKESPERLETPAAITRALAKLRVKREPEHPYRDRGPLVAFRANAPTRDQKDDMLAAAHDPGQAKEYPKLPPWARRFEFLAKIQDVRYLWLIAVAGNLLILLPLLGFRGIWPLALPLSIGYWILAYTVVYGYRRRMN